MWSFVGKKNNKQWIRPAIDLNSREIICVYIGSRDRMGTPFIYKLDVNVMDMIRLLPCQDSHELIQARDLHHIIAGCIERRRLVNHDQDSDNFLERPGMILEQTRTLCYAWTLIPNHFHLLLRVPGLPLWLLC
jgi:hypothetical protein